MGRDVLGFMSKDVTVLDIKKAIEDLTMSDVELFDNGLDFYNLRFNFKNENRQFNVFEKFTSHRLDNEEVTLVSLRKWGCANELTETLVRNFGGYYLADDCSNEDPIFIEKNNNDGSLKVIPSIKLLKLVDGLELPLHDKLKVANFLKNNKSEVIKLLIDQEC